MKTKLFTGIFAIAILLSSCNKDQSAVNKLDGEWTATKMLMTESTLGFAIDLIAFGGSMKFSFDGCKLKNDEWCTATSTMTFDGDTETETMVYRVTGDGTTLEAKDSETATTVTIITITELSRKNCKLKQVDGTTTIDLELTKD